jgi:hypothetical protein
MHSTTLHLHTFQSFCFVLEPKPSLYVQTTEGKIHKISKVGLISNQGVLQKFFKQNQSKTEKKRKRKREKVKKAAGQHSGPGQLPAHNPPGANSRRGTPASPTPR